VEEAVHDEEGQLRTASFADYSLLTAAELPPVESRFVETPSPLNPLGAKGIGEGGAIATPAAVANAVADALAPFGVRHVDPPFTEAKLWSLLQEAGS
jgi:carbon-monoxide dehydrogenase large subunit